MTQKRVINVVKWVCLFFIATAKVDYFLVIWHLASPCVMSLSFPSLSNFTCPFSFLLLQDGVGILSPFQEWLWTVDHRITQAAGAQLDAASSWGCHSSSPSLWSTASCLCQDQEGDELPVTAESGNTTHIRSAFTADTNSPIYAVRHEIKREEKGKREFWVSCSTLCCWKRLVSFLGTV